MNPVRAIFWIGRVSFFGSAVRLATRQGISHCELLFADGISGTSAPELDGVGTYRFTDWAADGVTPNPANWLTLDLDLTEAEAFIARLWFYMSERAGYDYRGVLFSQLFPWNWEDPKNYFCSEACIAALQLAGRLPHLRPHRISPAGMHHLLAKSQAP
jgi:hypothetical protein